MTQTAETPENYSRKDQLNKVSP